MEQQEVRLLDLCRSGTFRLELLVARMEGLSTLLVDLRARLAELDEQRAREENALAACERVREYCLMVSARFGGTGCRVQEGCDDALGREGAGGPGGGDDYGGD